MVSHLPLKEIVHSRETFRGPSLGPSNNGGPGMKALILLLQCHSTLGSTGQNLTSTTSVILTLDSPPVTLPTGAHGLFPRDTVGLILGKSFTSLQGIHLIPGVIDSGYTGEIKIMLQPPTKTIQTHAGRGLLEWCCYYVLGVSQYTPEREALFQAVEGFGWKK